jgi:hypothetical protein
MNTPDIAGLSNKFRCRATTYNVLGGHYAYTSDDCALDNEAADTLERQAAEIERLRGALKEARIIVFDATMEDRYPSLAVEIFAQIDAALTGEDAVPVKLHD